MANAPALPEVGSFWRERRTAYSKRIVEVRGFTPKGRYVVIRTVVNEEGQRPSSARRHRTTQVDIYRWYQTFAPETQPVRCGNLHPDSGSRCVLPVAHKQPGDPNSPQHAYTPDDALKVVLG
jgi:hypothetical protein